MEKIELHFFHGFLGHPKDWFGTQESLEDQNSFQFINHNLVEDFSALKANVSFESWAQYKEKSFSQNKKILVAYSLGGRLALHLEPDCYNALILIGAHPGLTSGVNERAHLDQDWLNKAKQCTQKEWLSLWNKQEVFNNDRVRPEREFTTQEWSLQLELLPTWSLAKQSVMDEKIEKYGHKIFWAYGEKDEKFKTLSGRMKNLVGEKNVFEVSDSGHGVPFDNPGDLATIITEVKNRVC